MRKAPGPLAAGLVLVVGTLAASSALALGFGRVSTASTLGQALNFSVPLRFEADEFVAAECIVAEVQAGDDHVPVGSVHVSIDAGRDGGENMLRITTSGLVNEPIVEVSVNIGCPVRLTRKFVVFVDPPAINLAQAPVPVAPPADAAASAAANASPPGDVAATSAPVAASDAGKPIDLAAQTPVLPTERRSPRAIARKDIIPAERPSSAASVPRSPRVAAAPRAPGGARLKLDPSDVRSRAGAASAATGGAAAKGSAPAPMAAASATPAATAAAATPAVAAATKASEAASTQAAQSAAALASPSATSTTGSAASAVASSSADERLQALEQSINKLKAESEASRSSITTLQARLHDAESSRYSNPLVYVLAALVLLLLIALLVLFRLLRQSEQRREAWWNDADEDELPRRRDPAADATSSQAAFDAALEAELLADSPPAAAAMPRVVIEPTPMPTGPITWKPTAAIPELDTRDVPKRAVTAEELIDLEQQAEFFVTLGQDEAAIDLLASHIQTAGGLSPLPYLKLLEIHHRRLDRLSYERVREQFRQRFQAPAPAWDDGSAPRPLEKHADVVASLQEIWPAPARAMGLLEQLLFRRGDGEDAFDLLAYRELLMLYEVARDLAAHGDAPTSVDFELPLSGDSDAGHSVIGHASVDLDLDSPTAPAFGSERGARPR